MIGVAEGAGIMIKNFLLKQKEPNSARLSLQAG